MLLPCKDKPTVCKEKLLYQLLTPLYKQQALNWAAQISYNATTTTSTHQWSWKYSGIGDITLGQLPMKLPAKNDNVDNSKNKESGSPTGGEGSLGSTSLRKMDITSVSKQPTGAKRKLKYREQKQVVYGWASIWTSHQILYGSASSKTSVDLFRNQSQQAS